MLELSHNIAHQLILSHLYIQYKTYNIVYQSILSHLYTQCKIWFFFQITLQFIRWSHALEYSVKNFEMINFCTEYYG